MTPPLDLKSLDPEVFIEIMKKSGLNGNIEQMIFDDLEKGFKLNSDDTINIIEYCAWLMVQSSRRVE